MIMHIQESCKSLLRNSSKRVHFNFIISYIIIFLIPILVIFFVYYGIVNNIINDELENAALVPVMQVKNAFEDDVNRVRTIGLYIQTNEELSRLYYKTEEEFTFDDILSVSKISRQLAYYMATNPFIETLYVRLNNSDRCITNGGAKSGKYLYEDIHNRSNADFSYEQWLHYMNNYTSGSLVPADPIEKRISNKLYFFQSLPMIPRGINDGIFVVGLTSEAWFQSVANTSNTDFYMLDDDLRVYCSTNTEAPLSVNDIDFAEKFGTIAENGQIVAYAKSDMLPITVFSITPDITYRKKLRDTQRIFFVILITCITIGLLLTYYFTKRNYSPIRQLFQIVHQYGSLSKEFEDPYAEIRQALTTAMDGKIMEAIHKKRKFDNDQKEGLMMLLHDSRDNFNLIEDIIHRNKLRLGNYPYYTLRFAVSDYGEFLEEFEVCADQEMLQPLMICQNIYTEIFSSRFITESFIYGEQIILFINVTKPNDDIPRLLKEMVLEAQRFIRDNYSIDTYGAGCALQDNLQNIKLSIAQSSEVLSYVELEGRQSFMVYGESAGKRNQQVYTIKKEENLFLSSLNAGNFTLAVKQLDFLVEKNFNDQHQNLQVLRCKLYSLMSQVIDAFTICSLPAKDKAMEIFDVYNRILSCTTVSGFYEEVKSLLTELSQYYQNTELDEGYLFKEQVISIVKENYMNYDLNVSFIADTLSKNLDYVSRTFKKTTKIGLLDYIHLTRVEESKKLLASEDNLSIKQISSMVGYLSCDSYIRAFKRYVGMTPGKYRENHSETKNT